MNSFRSKFFSGLIHNFFGGILTQALNIIVSILLTRLIDPSSFGLLAMVTVLGGYVSVFVDSGFSNALVQRKTVEQDLLNSVFWFSLLISIFFFLMFFFFAGPISSFYKEPNLVGIVRWIAVGFLCSPLISIPQVILRRQMSFKLLNYVTFFSTLLSSFGALYLAYAGKEIVALLFRILSQQVFMAMFSVKAARWYPALVFRPKELRKIYKFGSNFLAVKSVHYWTRNFDNILVGKFLGSTSLGIYSRASNAE